MRRRTATLFAMLVLVAAACGSDAADTTTSPPEESAAPTTPAPAGTEAPTPSEAGGHPLVISAVDFEANVIEIRNAGTETVDVSGFWLCNRPSYLEIPSQELAPGDALTIVASDLGVTPESGEVGLYSSRSFGSAGAMLRYVQWGSDEHGRTSVAIEAGVWPQGEFVDNDGANLRAIGDDPTSSADWSSG